MLDQRSHFQSIQNICCFIFTASANLSMAFEAGSRSSATGDNKLADRERERGYATPRAEGSGGSTTNSTDIFAGNCQKVRSIIRMDRVSTLELTVLRLVKRVH